MYKILLLLLISINCYSQDSTVYYVQDTTYTLKESGTWLDYGDSAYNYINNELVCKKIIDEDTTFLYSYDDGFWIFQWKAITYHLVTTLKVDVMQKETVIFVKNNNIGVRSDNIIKVLKVYDSTGNLLALKSPLLKEFDVDINYKGIVIITVEFDQGDYTEKFLLY